MLNVSGRVFSFRDDGKECAARVQSCENPELCAVLCSALLWLLSHLQPQYDMNSAGFLYVYIYLYGIFFPWMDSFLLLLLLRRCVVVGREEQHGLFVPVALFSLELFSHLFSSHPSRSSV